MLNAVRLSITAASHGESAEIALPLTSGEGRFRYGSKTSVRPVVGLVTTYSYRLACLALRSEETLMLGQIFGDDVIEDAGDEGALLTWNLGETFQAAAEIASAFSSQWYVRAEQPPDSPSRPGLMTWLSRRLGEDRLGESVELDGSQRLIVLVPGEEEGPNPLPLLNGLFGRGIYAIPVLALHRLLLEEPSLLEGDPITGLTIQPRGAAMRWRDRLGRMVYVVPPDSRGMVVRHVGLINPVVLEAFPDEETDPTPPE